MGIRLTARQPLFGYVAVTALLAAVHYARPAAWTAGVMDLLAAAGRA